MRILLDTNIFIPMEDSSINLDEELAKLHRLSLLNFELLIHPESAKDIKRDKNESRRSAMLSRLAKYQIIDSPIALKEHEENELFGKPKKDNDRVDNRILFALYKDCAHLLITEDQGIHKKAAKLNIGERVLTTNQLVTSLEHLDQQDNQSHPDIKNMYCYELDLYDPLFISLRQGYNSFDKWFTEQCCQEARMAWVSLNEHNLLNAICIYKLEKDPIVTIDNKGLRGEVVKLCTFKVTKTGFKFGELLLKQAFTYAIENKVDYIYLTIEPEKHAELQALVLNYGFIKFGIDEKGRDEVFVKEFLKNLPVNSLSLSPLDFSIRYFPIVRISTNNAYIIPIKPHYHQRLFPEAQKQKSLLIDQENSAGNSLLQAYLCKSPIKSINPGDILFFYRSDDHQAITSYGIVEQFIIESDPEMILQWVAKRTVYTYRDIELMAGGKVKIILFRVVHHLNELYDFDKMMKDKVINGSIQSITRLSTEKLNKLINVVGINDRFISD